MAEIWLFWVILGGFVLFNGMRVLQDTRNFFAPPLIVSVLAFGVLVKSYFLFDEVTLGALLDHDYYLMTMAYTALCLLVYSIAYTRGLCAKRFRGWPTPSLETVPFSWITLVVAVFVVLGFGAQWIVAREAGGYVEFYSKSHGSAVDVTQISGYIHGMPMFLWSAFLIGCLMLWRVPSSRRLLLIVLTTISGIALFLHTFLFGNRNGVIRFVVFLGACYVFIRRPSLYRAVPLIVLLLIAAAVVMVLPHLREHLHLGAEEPLVEGFARYVDNLRATGGRQRLSLDAGGHELFFNVGVVHAAFVSGTYDYGAQFAYVPISFVPRFLWPEKPYEVDFGVNYFDLVGSVLGWSPGAGAAINAIGFSFSAFSWLGCLLWGLFGYASGRVVRAAREDPSIFNLGRLCAWLMANIYWGTQGVTSVFWGWCFTIVPFLVLATIARRKTKGRQMVLGVERWRTSVPRAARDELFDQAR